jgi:GTP pyrophosphokinase
VSNTLPRPLRKTLAKADPASYAPAASFAALTSHLDYLAPTDLDLVRKAYCCADEVHLGQLRNGGLPYITHPIAVAALCAEWKLDAHALMAALLHDALEDCSITKSELVDRFGATVAEMVDGLTKLDRLHFNSREETQAESFRKMLLAMARDVRVILIKLADRVHNMRTLSDLPREKWGRISKETLDIYAPIAHRLGLNQTFRELQDLAFQHLQPWRYQVLSKAIAKARSRRRDLIKKVQKEVKVVFDRSKLPVQMGGREKTLFSIYKKMDAQHLSFAQITDIYGFRLILDGVTECYTALGLLHQLYKPVPGKFKDHIAIPKLNGYQSLHTTLVGPSGINVEFQIRTPDMNLVAESGVAAHWLYKADVQDSEAAERLGTQWLQSLLDIQKETRDAAEFWDHVKVDLFPDAVYVFTPKSQILSLPRGATVVDFAYAIHSNIGDHAVGARINGLPVQLRQELHNGDVIEVITEAASWPQPTWMSFVRTGRARSKIRHHLKTLEQTESRDLGEKLLTQALRAEGIDALPVYNANGTRNDLWEKLLRFTGNKHPSDLMTDLGLGKRIAHIVAKRIATLMAAEGKKPDALLLSKERFVAAAHNSVLIDGSENASIQFATCCRPVPGDTIVGYLGRGEGLMIHCSTCATALRLLHKDAERFIPVEWSEQPVRLFEVALMVLVHNGKGVLAQVSSTLAKTEVDIAHIDMGQQTAQVTVELHFVVTVRDVAHLTQALLNLNRSSSVIRAERIKSPNPIK